MMVGELINILKQYNPYLPVCIGEIQSFRSNFAIEIDDIDVIVAAQKSIMMILMKPYAAKWRLCLVTFPM